MALVMAETYRGLLCNKITFINPRALVGIIKICHLFCVVVKGIIFLRYNTNYVLL